MGTRFGRVQIETNDLVFDQSLGLGTGEDKAGLGDELIEPFPPVLFRNLDTEMFALIVLIKFDRSHYRYQITIKRRVKADQECRDARRPKF